MRQRTIVGGRLLYYTGEIVVERNQMVNSELAIIADNTHIASYCVCHGIATEKWEYFDLIEFCLYL